MLHHRWSPKDSKPSSWYKCYCDVPWIVSVIGMQALYWIFSIWPIFWGPMFNNSFYMKNYHLYRQQTSNVWKGPWYYTTFEKILDGYRIFHFSYCAFNFNLKYPNIFFCRIFAFFSNNLLLSECSFLRNSSPTLLFCEFM